MNFVLGAPDLCQPILNLQVRNTMQIRIVVRGAIGLNLAPKGDYGMLVRVPVMTNLYISRLLLHSQTRRSPAVDNRPLDRQVMPHSFSVPVFYKATRLSLLAHGVQTTTSNASPKFVSTEALWDRIRFASMAPSVNARHESSVPQVSMTYFSVLS